MTSVQPKPPSRVIRSVAVIIPAYNAEAYLETCVRSVLAQSYPVHEVIIVDDGSTDGTRQPAESFGGCVRVLCQRNQGLSVTRNQTQQPRKTSRPNEIRN